MKIKKMMRINRAKKRSRSLKLKENISQVEAILFDLDGTLLDTDRQVVERLARRLRPFLGKRSQKIAHWLLMKSETLGNLLVTLLDFLHLEETFMPLTDRLRRRRGVYPAHQFRLIAGVDETIQQLSHHYRLGLITTRSRYHIDQFLDRFPQIAAVIDTTCGLQDTHRLKPHPSPLKLAAKRLGIPVENCLMVGDTTVDVRAAQRAGAWSAAVLCGFGQQDELKRAGAHIILETTADLADFLKGTAPPT
jgi:phosphoglycolate phosphatase